MQHAVLHASSMQETGGTDFLQHALGGPDLLNSNLVQDSQGGRFREGGGLNDVSGDGHLLHVGFDAGGLDGRIRPHADNSEIGQRILWT